MNRTKIIILFVLSFVAAIQFYNPLVAGAEQYLCVTEHSTGFFYNKSSRSWERRHFRTDNKYIIRKSNSKDISYKVIEVGEKIPDYICKDEFDKDGYLYCENSHEYLLGTLGIRINSGNFSFNKENGRFLEFIIGGYISDDKDSPYISIGVCSPF